MNYTTYRPLIGKKGLTSYSLKMIATILMFINHIYSMLNFAGAPYFFHIIGRPISSVFIFLMVEGHTHTSNKKKYFLRLWLMSVFMGALNFVVSIYFKRTDGFSPANNIFASLALLFFLWNGIEAIEQREWKKALLFIGIPVMLQLIYLILPAGDIKNAAFNICQIAIPLPTLVEGGALLICRGLLLFIFRKKPKLQIAAFAVFTLCAYFGMIILTEHNFTIDRFLQDYSGVFSILAVVFMGIYNGARGKKAKDFFYIFYPAHIYVLYAISCLII